MPRRFDVGLAVVALLSGFSAAPFTHAHYAIDSVTDAQHPHGATLIHSHASSHAHQHSHDVDPQVPHEDDTVRAVDGFVLPPASPPQGPVPCLPCCGAAVVEVVTCWLGAQGAEPNAHAPPAGTACSLRAPPVTLPAVL